MLKKEGFYVELGYLLSDKRTARSILWEQAHVTVNSHVTIELCVCETFLFENAQVM